MRGLGQNGEAVDIQEGGTYQPPPPSPQVYTPSTTTPPWWLTDIFNPLLKTGSTIASYELNPLYQKGTYYQTPQGAVYASNVPSGYVPGLTTTTGAISFLPILLIGGLVLLLARRK
jgi:hypothetical protein